MERQKIPIRFADLRQVASTVPTYLATKVGESRIPTMRSEVESEFNLAGLDTEELIWEFAETYQVKIDTFDFTGLISLEPGIDATSFLLFLFFFPVLAYLASYWLLRGMAGLLCYPFDSPFAKRIWQQPLPMFWLSANKQPLLKPLTVGDFVASAAVGRFVKREQVYFHLVR